jgi:hypothetical protein
MGRLCIRCLHGFRRPQGLTFVQLAQAASPNLREFASFIAAGVTEATNKPRRSAMPGACHPFLPRFTPSANS